MLHYANGSKENELNDSDLKDGLFQALNMLGAKKKVIAVGPDITRYHSRAGYLTEMAWEYYGQVLTDVLPAIGTHAPMTPEEMDSMYGKIPHELFRVHDWKNGLTTLGTVPSSKMRELSEGKLDFEWPAQVDERLVSGGYDLILSIGQVVPHEVIGMANYTKNLLVGTGGSDGINLSHYLGAVYGMERILGRIDTPVRELMDYAAENFSDKLPMVIYILTVVSADKDGSLHTRGLFIGDDRECYEKAARLSEQVNIFHMEKALSNVVAYMDPSEYRSTWIGNKAIYRTRMAVADGGKLTVIAPGVKECGENQQIDRLIKKYGYVGTDKVLKLVEENEDLRNNLGTAAHLIHGSTEGRFSVTLCPGFLSRDEVESINYTYGDPDEMLRRYTPHEREDGFHRLPDGEEFYLVKNPALGLWKVKSPETD